MIQPNIIIDGKDIYDLKDFTVIEKPCSLAINDVFALTGAEINWLTNLLSMMENKPIDNLVLRENTLQRRNEAPIDETPPLRCMDCTRPYSAFGLDLVLPNDQWKQIHPDESGVLCAQCIVNRAEKLGAVVAHMKIEYGTKNPA